MNCVKKDLIIRIDETAKTQMKESRRCETPPSRVKLKKLIEVITFLPYSHVNKLSPIINYHYAFLNKISKKLLMQLLKAVIILHSTNKQQSLHNLGAEARL